MRPARITTVLRGGTLLLLLCSAGIGADAHGVSPDETTLRSITRSPAHVQQSAALPTALPPSEPHVHMARPTGTAPQRQRQQEQEQEHQDKHNLDLRGIYMAARQEDATATVPAAPDAPPAVITEAPTVGDTTGTALGHHDEGIITGVDPEGRTWRFRQTTYYSCLTRGATYTHCGWHRPILEAGAGRFGVRGDGMGIAARAGVAAGLVAVALGG